MPTITKKFVDRTEPPAAGQQFYRDTEIRGFGLRVTSETVDKKGKLVGGTRSFLLEARVKGRPRRITIGRFPDWSVAQARERALELKGIIAHGGDPTEDRARERRELTFGDLSKRYIDQHAKEHKKSWKQDEARINSDFGRWKGRRLSDISADEVAKLHHDIGKQRGKFAANRMVSLLRAMFNLAIQDWKVYKGENPAAGVRLFPERRRERFLSPDELKRVNDALLAEPNQYWRAFFPLALMLGPRRGELLAARWAHIDLAQRTWSLPETKSGRSHLLPLPAPAVAILESLPSNGTSEFVFPGKGKTGHLVEPKSVWHNIRTRAGVPDVRIHDLRRTLGSWLAASGRGLPLIGAALNHSSPASTAIYARLALDPVRQALEQNAAAMFGGELG